MHSDARDFFAGALEVGKLFFFDTLMVDPLTKETWLQTYRTLLADDGLLPFKLTDCDSFSCLE